MRFEQTDAGWNEGQLRQKEAARVLGVCERTFGRDLVRMAYIILLIVKTFL
jgi:hypothetical protein